tara:strand:- start:188 stop:523 length:336 start_codon:yes stop_codon:yes gene_type:complete
MSHYPKHNQTSEQVQSESLAIARSTQKPGQTKAQTKLVAKGIAKGIETYKKQQSAKARKLDKRLKKSNSTPPPAQAEHNSSPTPPVKNNSRTPWLLLAISWILFGTYIALQ